MPGYDTAYAPFIATHEDRLVCSLVSESGLSPAAARAVAADVLPAAHARSFASDGAAYGWLRVAARHRAAGSPGWADAADAAVAAALGGSAAALAGLSAADRELLRLRYVEGLLPAALAARLGVAEAEVRARLDRARGTATRSLTKPRTLAVPLPRAAAALAAAAAAAFVSFGGGVSPGSPPALARRAPAPYADAALPQPVVPVASGEEPAAANGRVTVRPPGAVDVPGRTPVVAPPRRPGDDGDGSGGGCRSGCRPPTVLTDELHIHVPSEIADVVGQKEVVVEQQVAQDVVSVCETVPAIPAGVASCVPARH